MADFHIMDSMIYSLNRLSSCFNYAANTKAFYNYQTWKNLSKDAYKTAAKVVSFVLVLGFLAWSFYRCSRWFFSRAVSTSSQAPKKPTSTEGLAATNPASSSPQIFLSSIGCLISTDSSPLSTDAQAPTSSPSVEMQNLDDSDEDRSSSFLSPTPHSSLYHTPPESVTPVERHLQSQDTFSQQLTEKLQKLAKGSPSLDQFRMEFSRLNLRCEYRGEKGDVIQTIFGDYLLKTLFRENEILDCAFDQNLHFELKYREAKVIPVKELPPRLWKKMSFLVKPAVIGLLKITPGIRLSQCFKGQIIKHPVGVQILFEENAISLTPNRLGYTAHLKSIVIIHNLNIKQNGGHHLILDVEHNASRVVKEKSGPFNHQLFVDMLDVNFFPERYQKRSS